MITQLLKGLLALCVASTLTLVGATSADAASSQRGTDRAATQQSTQRSTHATERAGACTKQWRGLRKAKRAEDRGDQRLYNARKAMKRADSRHEKRAASKRVTRAKRIETRTDRQLKKARKAWRKCRDAAGSGGGTGGGGGGTGGGSSTNPLQPACDAGLPQAICDAFGQLPMPGGSGGASPIQPLCNAGLPQAICDAATAPPGPGGASPIQPLCSAGLPQAICDAAAGSGGVPNPGTVLAPVCGLGLPIPGVCATTTSQVARARAA
ncbi:hypothetical protein GON03_12880 [Nocardioides sp. MAH-18]|uniref:Uncharacterized protein n=1 Tax=Nocardioides agri TaxID=2682843 RepID=A0A6L6XTU6_9ACTN|nr:MULTISPECIES: hypothetical protein [unclassified Nocardioides]MBA2955226.1 hypothetical protein [Nocardioides sp. CGMCC 1.13656]MVQ50077.1 hypothetical protein [Nocardioides sp. MAH-18]